MNNIVRAQLNTIVIAQQMDGSKCCRLIHRAAKEKFVLRYLRSRGERGNTFAQRRIFLVNSNNIDSEQNAEA